jgi:integrase
VKIVKRTTRDGETRYLARVEITPDPATGTRREIGKTFRTKKEAERWQRQYEARRDAGPLAPMPRLTLNAHLDAWLAGLNDVGGRTLEDYTNLCHRYLRPLLGARRLDQLHQDTIREMLATLAKPKTEGGRGLAPRTVQYVHAVLRLALNQAVADKKLPINPAVGSRMAPRQVRREMQVLTSKQVLQVLDQTRDDPHGALWAVLLLAGLRPSEALALRWADVNLDRAELRVVRKLRRPKNGAAWVIEEPKSERGRRVVPLVPAAVDALARLRDRQAVERVIAAEGYATHDLVFADLRGEPWRADGVTKYAWTPMLQRLQLPAVRLYDARHSCATMLLEAGQPMKVVQEMLGHASMILTADTYSHVTPAFKRQAADALAAHLGRARDARVS